jgi:hypothetical protein
MNRYNKSMLCYKKQMTHSNGRFAFPSNFSERNSPARLMCLYVAIMFSQLTLGYKFLVYAGSWSDVRFCLAV